MNVTALRQFQLWPRQRADGENLQRSEARGKNEWCQRNRWAGGGGRGVAEREHRGNPLWQPGWAELAAPKTQCEYAFGKACYFKVMVLTIDKKKRKKPTPNARTIWRYSKKTRQTENCLPSIFGSPKDVSRGGPNKAVVSSETGVGWLQDRTETDMVQDVVRASGGRILPSQIILWTFEQI